MVRFYFQSLLLNLKNNELIIFEGTYASDEGCGLKYKRAPN